MADPVGAAGPSRVSDSVTAQQSQRTLSSQDLGSIQQAIRGVGPSSVAGEARNLTNGLDGYDQTGGVRAQTLGSLPDGQVTLAQSNGATIPGAGPVQVPDVGLRELRGLALRVGPAGALVGGAEIMNGIQSRIERGQVDSALQRFDLNPASATDVLGARAYTWSNNNAFRPGAIPGVPMFGAGAIPTSGPELERVSQGIMNLERAAPETLGRWTNDRDATAGAMLEATVTDILAGNTVERRSSVDPALSTNSSTARGVAAATAGGMQRWQAHHLVPFAEVASLPVATQQAIAASGWRMDSPGNLIALPADIASFQGPPNNGALPMHSGAHPNYSAEAGRMLNVVAAAHAANPNMTPQEMRALMTTVETEMRAQIRSRMWHNVVR